jgi:polyamine oxidase
MDSILNYNQFVKEVKQAISNCDSIIYDKFGDFIDKYSIETDHCCQDKLISKPIFEVILQFMDNVADDCANISDYSIHFADYDLYSLWKIIYIKCFNPVIVIGAGISGLTIAEGLSNFMILEARDRIGGRVYTNDKNLDDGAAWIHGTCDNPLMKLVMTDDLIPIAQNNPWMHSENADIKYLNDDRDFTEETRQQLAQKWSQVVDQIVNSIQDPDHVTIDEAFANSKYDEEIKSFLYMIEVWCGGSIKNLPVSFLKTLECKTALYGDYAGSHCIFKKGAETILNSFSSKDKIKLSTIVTEVKYNDCFVEVHTRDGRSYVCEKLCITIPPGPLRDIKFDPPLEKARLDSLSRVKMGSYKKIQIEFDEVFWNNSAMILTRDYENHEFPYILWNNYALSKGLPILEAICPANHGWSMAGKSDEDIMESVMKHLNLYYKNVPFPKS